VKSAICDHLPLFLYHCLPELSLCCGRSKLRRHFVATRLETKHNLVEEIVTEASKTKKVYERFGMLKQKTPEKWLKKRTFEM
jgi:hypothetical protein